mgnify:CR=1 FL=1
MNKRMIQYGFVVLMLAFVLTGCGQKNNDIKVYENTEEVSVRHEETSMTAIITSMDMENNQMHFVSVLDGTDMTLQYHGGVRVSDTKGTDIGIDSVVCGNVVDIVYYADTEKLVSIAKNAKVKTYTQVKKFLYRQDQHTASCNGTSYKVSDYAQVFDGNQVLSLADVNTEDEVTLSVWNGNLVSVVITKGHGYVRLLNQGTYVGGFVEIGKDVIVPVTVDMLVAVGEGDYTLRINKNGYSGEKSIRVTKDRELNVDISDIAIPSGTVTFAVTPEDAGEVIKVDGEIIANRTYTGLYGDHELSITAEGYDSFRGSFKITDTMKNLHVTLQQETTEESTEETTEATTQEAQTTTSGQTTQATEATQNPQTTSATTQSGQTTESAEQGNKITIKKPEGVGVYFDGDYVGIAPVSIKKTAGTHTITLYKAGYLIKSYTIQAEDDGKDDEYSYADLISVLD